METKPSKSPEEPEIFHFSVDERQESDKKNDQPYMREYDLPRQYSPETGEGEECTVVKSVRAGLGELAIIKDIKGCLHLIVDPEMMTGPSIIPVAAEEKTGEVMPRKKEENELERGFKKRLKTTKLLLFGAIEEEFGRWISGLDPADLKSSFETLLCENSRPMISLDKINVGGTIGEIGVFHHQEAGKQRRENFIQELLKSAERKANTLLQASSLQDLACDIAKQKDSSVTKKKMKFKAELETDPEAVEQHILLTPHSPSN